MIDSLWILVSAALVFIMQAGFTCLESGIVRKKIVLMLLLKT